MHKNALVPMAVFAMLAFSSAAFAAVVQGSVYDAGTLELVDKAIVTASTVPEQVRVSENGSYSFEIPDGNYTITARKFEGGSLALVASENIEARDNGTYAVDLLMLPPSEFSEMNESSAGNAADEENLTQIENLSVQEGAAKMQQGTGAAGREAGWQGIAEAGFGIALLLLLAYFLVQKYRKHGGISGMQPVSGKAGKSKEPETPASARMMAAGHASKAAAPMAPELPQAISILRKSGGHMTQKELRKALPFSEAKVSLIVTELEEIGAVRKFKRGRGNIIKLLK